MRKDLVKKKKQELQDNISFTPQSKYTPIYSPPHIVNKKNHSKFFRIVSNLWTFVEEGVPYGEVGYGRNGVNINTQEPVEGEERDV